MDELNIAASGDKSQKPVVWFALTLVALVAIAVELPNFIPMRGKVRSLQDKTFMHTLQLSLEGYATDCAGTYASHVKDALPYYPGGSDRPGGFPGVVGDCMLIDVPVTAEKLQRMNAHECAALVQSWHIPNGRVWVGLCDNGGNKTSYSVVGGTGSSFALGNQGKILILSNPQPATARGH